MNRIKILYLLFTLLLFAGCSKDGKFINSEDNTAPSAYDINTTTLVNIPVDIILQATDPESNQLTYIIVDSPTHGTLTQKSFNIYRYTPASDYEGGDSFIFLVNDGKVNSNTAKVSIMMGVPNHAPIAYDSSVKTPFNTSCEISLALIDVDNDPVELEILQQPEHGTLEKSGDKYYYQPANNHYGPDSVKYRGSDPYSTGNIGTITIDVEVTNTPPVAVDITATVEEDTEYTLPFAITPDSYELWDKPVTYSIVEQPEHGTVTYDGVNDKWIFTPENNYNGVITFYYKSYDGIASSLLAAKVTINITPIADAPAVADYTLIVTESDKIYNIPFQGTDPDGATITYEIGDTSSLPGNLSFSGGNAGYAVYTSPSVPVNYGLYSFTYNAADPEGHISNTGTVYIVIRPKNVWFVNPNNTGYQTGECWHHGYRYISDAIAKASPGDSIWLRGGAGIVHTLKPNTYTVADLTGKTDSINSTGISIIGGFILNEYNPVNTDPSTNPSIVNGEGKALHIFIAESFSSFRNITVTGGNANGTGESSRGGGIYIPESKTVISITDAKIGILDIINGSTTDGGSYAVYGGGLYIGAGSTSISITGTDFLENSSGISGGGAAIGDGSTVSFNSCHFLFNSTEDYGGGLSNMGIVTAIACYFSYNKGQYGGGLYDHNNPSTYTSCSFTTNTASKSGGGIFNYGRINLTGCYISGGNSAPRGGGIFNDASGIAGSIKADISNCNITGNSSSQYGGGIFNLHSTVTISNNSNVNSNQSAIDGGGIYCSENTNLTLDSSKVYSNSAANNGGGIYTASYSIINIIYSQIYLNQASNSEGCGGGGIYLSKTKGTIADSEIYSNTARNGGGIYISEYSNIGIIANTGYNCYIQQNTAVKYGGGIYAENSTFAVTKAHIYMNNFTELIDSEYLQPSSGSGGGIYAKSCNVTLNSAYIEKNFGPAYYVDQNYSGYHLVGCENASLLLAYSVVTIQNKTYNLIYANYLSPTANTYFQFNPLPDNPRY